MEWSLLLGHIAKGLGKPLALNNFFAVCGWKAKNADPDPNPLYKCFQVFNLNWSILYHSLNVGIHMNYILFFRLMSAIEC